MDEQVSYGMRLEAELTRSKTANSRLELGLQEMVHRSAANALLHEAEKHSLEESKEAALNAAQFENENLQKAIDKVTQEYNSCSGEMDYLKQRLSECKVRLT